MSVTWSSCRESHLGHALTVLTSPNLLHPWVTTVTTPPALLLITAGQTRMETPHCFQGLFTLLHSAVAHYCKRESPIVIKGAKHTQQNVLFLSFWIVFLVFVLLDAFVDCVNSTEQIIIYPSVENSCLFILPPTPSAASPSCLTTLIKELQPQF